MKKFIALILFVIVSACTAETKIDDISQQQLLANDKAGTPQLILDVRTAEEYAAGHVPHAINISHQKVAGEIARIMKLSKGQEIPVVVYCRSGHRAGIALKTLQDNGFSNIKHLAGDMIGWKKSNQKIEK